MSLDLSEETIEARLREASRLAGPLPPPESRLSTKLDLSGRAIEARLRQASDLLALCRMLSRGSKLG